MIKVTIHSAEVRHMSGTSKTTQKPYNMAFQEGYFHTVGKDGKPAPYPQKVEFMLDKDKEGAALFYPPGEYHLDASSIYVDRNGRLALSVRLAKAPAKTAAQPS